MDRSLAPEGVEVHQEELENIETTKIEQILQRFLDLGQGGVVEGLQVSVNTANPATIDIAAGRGYAPNAEMIELPNALVGLGLADSTFGALNFVCLIYTEAETTPEAHATDGLTRPTRAVRGVRPRRMTVTQLGLLPASSNDMDIDARDRCLVVGRVTANGAAVPLTTASIVSTVVRTRLLGINRGATGGGLTVLSVLPGIEVVSLADATPTTQEAFEAASVNTLALLRYAFTGSGPTFAPTLAYRAPGDTTVNPAPTAILVDGSYTLTSTDSGLTIVVRVTSALLIRDGGVATYDEAVSVIDLYGEQVATGGARDESHRRHEGTVLARPANPHGQGSVDLGELQSILQSLVLGEGLISAVQRVLIPRLVIEHKGTGLGGRTLIGAFPMEPSTTIGRRFIRIFLTDGYGIEITVNARWDGALWHKDKNDGFDAATKLLFSDDALTVYGRLATTLGTWSDAAWSSAGLGYRPLLGTDGLGLLGWSEAQTALPVSLAAKAAARLVSNYAAIGAAGDNRTLLFQSASFAGALGGILRVYRSHASMASGTTQVGALELTLNARWDNTAVGNWAKDDDPSAAFKLELANDRLTLAARAAGAGTWTDVQASWNGVPHLFFSSGRTFTKSIPGVAGQWDTAPKSFVFAQGAVPFAAYARNVNPIVLLNRTEVDPVAADDPEGGPSYLYKGPSDADPFYSATKVLITWPIELPQGAIISGATVNLQSILTGSSVRATIVRQHRSAGGSAESFKAGGAGSNYTGLAAPAVPKALTLDDPVAAAPIDNTLYTYMVWMGVDAADTVGVRSIEIYYQISDLALA